MMLRATAVAAALVFAGCGEPPVQRLLTDLAHNPAKLPEALPKGTLVVMYLVRLNGATITKSAGPLGLPAETLALERALASRRDTQPPMWAVVVTADNKPSWWSPVDPVPKVRVSHADNGAFRAHGGSSATTETLVALRVPKIAGGRVVFYNAAGQAAGTIELGP